MNSFHLTKKHAKQCLNQDSYRQLVADIRSIDRDTYIAVRATVHNDIVDDIQVLAAPDDYPSRDYIWSYVTAASWLNS